MRQIIWLFLLLLALLHPLKDCIAADHMHTSDDKMGHARMEVANGHFDGVDDITQDEEASFAYRALMADAVMVLDAVANMDDILRYPLLLFLVLL